MIDVVSSELDEVITRTHAACLAEVTDDPSHRLSFARRRALLLALGPQQLDSKGYGTALTVGKRRRLTLAALAARRVSAFWMRDFNTPAVDSLLALVDRYLDDESGLADVRRMTDSMQGALLHDPNHNVQGYLAGRAVAAVGWVAVGDEVLSTAAGVTHEELTDPKDPDLWDPAFFAAGAWAGGMPWAPSFSADAYREFWLWYLDEAIALVSRAARAANDSRDGGAR
jgi:hypothetical protein